MPDDDAIVRRQAVIDGLLKAALEAYPRWVALDRIGTAVPWQPLAILGRSSPTEGDPDAR